MTRRWLLTLAVSVFILGLLSSAPIALLYAWLTPKDPPPRQLVGLSGTLGEGRVQAVVSNGRTVIGDLHWNLKPWWLLAGRFAAHIDGGGEDLLLDGGLSVTPGGTVRLTGLRANAGLKALLTAAGYPYLPVDGKAALNLDRLTLRDGLPAEAQGNGVVQNLAWTLARDPMPLGDFQLDLKTEGETVIATVASTSGPLEVQGDARVQPDGAWESLLRIKPRPEANPMLRNLVNSLGQPDLSGWYQLKRSGQLKPKAAPPPPT